MKNRCCKNPWGIVIAAFGLGILLECCFPSSFIVFVIAVAIIFAGILIYNC
ncbi:MAG: hypothetical protein IJU39_02455 [Clostridia bacterium]|nr:hypothetical protein [Clostridia bacterium]